MVFGSNDLLGRYVAGQVAAHGIAAWQNQTSSLHDADGDSPFVFPSWQFCRFFFFLCGRWASRQNSTFTYGCQAFQARERLLAVQDTASRFEPRLEREKERPFM